MIARREVEFTPDLPRSRRYRQYLSASGTEYAAYRESAEQSSASGIPSRRSKQVLDFDRALKNSGSESASEVVKQKQRHQSEQRFRTRGIEALLVIAVSTAFSSAAVMALARLIPYQTAQRDRLDEITAEVQVTEQRVESLRSRFPKMFNSGKSKDALIRQYGFVKPNQVPIKILDTDPSNNTTPKNKPSRP
jgi:cell division protein FtsB